MFSFLSDVYSQYLATKVTKKIGENLHTNFDHQGAAQHNVLASHPAGLGLILGVPKNFSPDAAENIDGTV